MSPHRNLDVLDAAELVAHEINEIIDSTPGLMHVDQLRRSAQSIGSNIREGMGRGPGRDRAHFLRTARASAEETIGHLRPNVVSGVIPESLYWRQHNRLVAITRMLTMLLRHPSSTDGGSRKRESERLEAQRRRS